MSSLDFTRRGKYSSVIVSISIFLCRKNILKLKTFKILITSLSFCITAQGTECIFYTHLHSLSWLETHHYHSVEL